MQQSKCRKIIISEKVIPNLFEGNGINSVGAQSTKRQIEISPKAPTNKPPKHQSFQFQHSTMLDLLHTMVFTSEYPFHYITAGAMGLMLLLVGFLFAYVPFINKGQAGKLFFHMRLGQLLFPFPRRKRRRVCGSNMGPLLLEWVPFARETIELSRVTVGEFLVLTCLVGEGCIWFWYGWVVGMERNHSLLRCTVRALGLVTQWVLMLMFIPVTRNSVLRMLFGLGFERSIKFHRWLSIIFWLAGLVHSGAWVLHMYVTDRMRWSGRTKTGLPALIVFTLTVFVAWEPIRRRFYEVFKYVHIAGTIASVVLFLRHERWTHSLTYVCIGLGPWLIDQVLRFIAPIGGLLWPASLVEMEYDERNEIIKLVVERPMWLWQNVAGAYVMLWIPRANPFLGHPVTVVPEIEGDHMCDGSLSLEEGHSHDHHDHHHHHDDDNLSVSDEIESSEHADKKVLHTKQHKFGKSRFLSNRFALYLKKTGGFTKRLAKLAQKVERGALDPRDLMVRVEGPYASTPIHFEALVLVAGGIGITPVLGILSHCVQKEDLQVKKIVIIWTVKNKSVVDKFAPTISKILRQKQWCDHIHHNPPVQSEDAPLIQNGTLTPVPPVEIQLYVTGEPRSAHDPSTVTNKFTCGSGCETAHATWSFGKRPDIQNVIEHLDKKNDAIKRASSVGVCCCGTQSMMDDVERACSLRRKFLVYSEAFNW